MDLENDKRILMFLNNISQNLRRGESLANSISVSKPSIKPELVKMIEAAEVSGKLSIVIKEMNLLLSTKTMLRQKITNALIYPIFLLLVTIIVSYFATWFLVNQIWILALEALKSAILL